MNSAVLAAFLSSMSSLSLAFVVIFDRLMVTDCYRNRPDQAWLVSSVVGAVFGLVASVATWIIVATTTELSLGSLAREVGAAWWSRGWLMVAAGAVAVQVTRHYFRLFTPIAGSGPVNETAIAMWLASTPIFLYSAVAVLQAVGLDRGLLAGLEQADVSWSFGALVALTVVALLRFEAAGGDGDRDRDRAPAGFVAGRHGQIVLLLATTVVYTVILSAVLLPETTSLERALALLPMYWIGFGAGGRMLLLERERSDFRRNWRRMKRFVVPILVAEVFGMTVFFAEYFALGAADPTLVNLFISAHVLLVFLVALRLARLRTEMETQGIRRTWFLGVRLARRNLPERTEPVTGQLTWLVIAVAGLASCIYATT